MRECHLVCGPPASGKSTFARALAAGIGGCLVDSDEIAERLIRAGLALAGLDPDDRDSPLYKKAYRDAVHETMYDIARSNLPAIPVVIAGPFTREGGDSMWLEELRERLGVRPVGYFVWCDPEVRRMRMVARGEARDGPKLERWEDYLRSCREMRPLWPHHFVDTSSA